MPPPGKLLFSYLQGGLIARTTTQLSTALFEHCKENNCLSFKDKDELYQTTMGFYWTDAVHAGLQVPQIARFNPYELVKGITRADADMLVNKGFVEISRPCQRTATRIKQEVACIDLTEDKPTTFAKTKQAAKREVIDLLSDDEAEPWLQPKRKAADKAVDSAPVAKKPRRVRAPTSEPSSDSEVGQVSKTVSRRNQSTAVNTSEASDAGDSDDDDNDDDMSAKQKTAFTAAKSMPKVRMCGVPHPQPSLEDEKGIRCTAKVVVGDL